MKIGNLFINVAEVVYFDVSSSAGNFIVNIYFKSGYETVTYATIEEINTLKEKMKS